MAKGKSLNPADAYRKAQRQKELKKIKETRQKTQKEKDAHKDTSDLQKKLDSLLALSSRTPNQDSEIRSLQKELKKINKAKEDYVNEHPDEKDKVFRKPGQGHGDYQANLKEQIEEAKKMGEGRRIFKKDGTLVDPKRSVYYDPVYNPFGVPPPGMPYLERPDNEFESELPAGEDSDEDDIPLPPGPPPPKEEGNDGDDDDIPLPEGPPPPKRFKSNYASSQPLFNRPSIGKGGVKVQQFHPLPQMPIMSASPFPPPPLPTHLSAPPMQLPQASFPPSPVGLWPPQQVAPYQHLRQPLHHPLPPRPVTISPPVNQPPPPVISASATITAAPQIRDLKKEAIAFVPQAVKKRKVQEAADAKKRVSSAPQVNDKSEGTNKEKVERTTLLGELKRGGLEAVKPMVDSHVKVVKKRDTIKDEYESFLEELDGI